MDELILLTIVLNENCNRVKKKLQLSLMKIENAITLHEISNEEIILMIFVQRFDYK